MAAKNSSKKPVDTTAALQTPIHDTLEHENRCGLEDAEMYCRHASELASELHNGYEESIISAIEALLEKSRRIQMRLIVEGLSHD